MVKENPIIKSFRYLASSIYVAVLCITIFITMLFIFECFDESLVPFSSAEPEPDKYIFWPTSSIDFLQPIMLKFVPKEALGWNDNLTFVYLKFYTEVLIIITVILSILFFLHLKTVLNYHSSIKMIEKETGNTGLYRFKLPDRVALLRMNSTCFLYIYGIYEILNDNGLAGIHFTREKLLKYDGANKSYIMKSLDAFSSIEILDHVGGNITDVIIKNANFHVILRPHGKSESVEFNILTSCISLSAFHATETLLKEIRFSMLNETLIHFGEPLQATPDGDDFSCEDDSSTPENQDLNEDRKNTEATSLQDKNPGKISANGVDISLVKLLDNDSTHEVKLTLEVKKKTT